MRPREQGAFRVTFSIHNLTVKFKAGSSGPITCRYPVLNVVVTEKRGKAACNIGMIF